MGWLWMDKPANVKAYLDKTCTWETETAVNRVLRSALVSMSEYYAAVETTEKSTGERKVWAAAFMVKFAKGEFGYKDMDESVGPYTNRCPEKILDLLTPTEYPHAMVWRHKCREYWAAKRDRTEQEWMAGYDQSVIAAWKSGLRVKIGYSEGFIRSVGHTHQFWITKVKNGRRGWPVTERDTITATKMGKSWIPVVGVTYA